MGLGLGIVRNQPKYCPRTFSHDLFAGWLPMCSCMLICQVDGIIKHATKSCPHQFNPVHAFEVSTEGLKTSSEIKIWSYLEENRTKL